MSVSGDWRETRLRSMEGKAQGMGALAHTGGAQGVAHGAPLGSLEGDTASLHPHFATKHQNSDRVAV